jgi:hypothetical protein
MQSLRSYTKREEMKIKIRKLDKWAEVTVEICGITLDLGLLDEEERSAMAICLKDAAEELESF